MSSLCQGGIPLDWIWVSNYPFARLLTEGRISLNGTTCQVLPRRCLIKIKGLRSVLMVIAPEEKNITYTLISEREMPVTEAFDFLPVFLSLLTAKLSFYNISRICPILCNSTAKTLMYILFLQPCQPKHSKIMTQAFQNREIGLRIVRFLKNTFL